MTQPHRRARHHISSAPCQQLSLIIQKYPTISAKITIRIIDQSIAGLVSILAASQTRLKNPTELMEAREHGEAFNGHVAGHVAGRDAGYRGFSHGGSGIRDTS